MVSGGASGCGGEQLGMSAFSAPSELANGESTPTLGEADSSSRDAADASAMTESLASAEEDAAAADGCRPEKRLRGSEEGLLLT